MEIKGLRTVAPAYAPEGEGGTPSDGDTGGEAAGADQTDQTTGEGAEDQSTEATAAQKLQDATDKAEAAASEDDKASEGEGEGDGEGGEEQPLKIEVSEDIKDSVDETKLEAFTTKAQELGLSQEQAQGVFDHYAAVVQAELKALSDGYAERISNWDEETSLDKEIGGDMLDENLSVAAQALKTFGSEELRSLLDPPSPKNPNGLGLGSNLALVRFFFNVGKAMSEDTLVRDGEKAEQEPLNVIGALYGREAQETGKIKSSG